MADTPNPRADLEGSPWGQILNRCCELIILADLPEIAGNVWIRDPPSIDGIPLPCVIMSPFTPSHSPDDGTQSNPDLTYRVMVGIVKAGNQVVNSTLAIRLEWFHTLFKLFAKQPTRLEFAEPGADGVQMLFSTVEPGDPSVAEAMRANYNAEWLALGFRVRYPSTN